MRRKAAFIIGIFITLFSVLSLSLFRWQIVEGAKWADLAVKNRKYVQTIQSQRGVIKARDGRILASNQIVYDIYIYKPNIKEDSLAKFVSDVAEIVGTPKESYQDALSDKQIQYFPIAKKITQDKKDLVVQKDCDSNTTSSRRAYKCSETEIAATHLTGIDIVQGSKRVYPNGSLASHVLGFVGMNDNGDEVGSNGVEGFYQEYLLGKVGTIEGIRDQAGNFILRDDLKTNAVEDGTYLQLTIDIGLQKIVEEKLKAQVEAQKAKGGTAIVMDPSTGDILALANYPTYDSSQYYNGEIIDCTQPRYKNFMTCLDKDPEKEKNPKYSEWQKLDQKEKDKILQQEKNIPAIFTDQGLSETREPGSIMKIVTASAAFNEGIANPQTKVPDHPGCIMITDRKVCTSNFVGAKNQTIDQVIEVSDNIGAYYIAKSLGSQKLYEYLDAFGIGKEVRVGLDGESIYSLKPWEDWTEIDLAVAAFGQGIVSTNSLENLNAINTVANGGKRIQPHIVKRFVSDSKTKDFSPQVIATPITPETAKTVVTMMERGTREGYTAPPLKDVLKNYTMAGKTGTAQIPDGKGGYIIGAYNNTYVGFAPAINPKLSMIITMREPEHGTYAGFSAVPVWRDIALEALPYLEVLPDKTPVPAKK